MGNERGECVGGGGGGGGGILGELVCVCGGGRGSV